MDETVEDWDAWLNRHDHGNFEMRTLRTFLWMLVTASAVGALAEPKPVLRAITVAGLKASCEQQRLSATECQQLRSGYVSGAYDALVAAQIMRNEWGAESAERAERMLECLGTQSREPPA